jgi:hypothetical protein
VYIRYPEKVVVVGHGVLFAVVKEFVSTDVQGKAMNSWCLNCYGPGSGSGAIVHEAFIDKESAMWELESAWDEIKNLGMNCLDMRVKATEDDGE